MNGNIRKRYVLGFLFDDSLNDVALIRKEKPAWQSKCLNGVGGKIKPDESDSAAMEREFIEEAGILIPAENWRLFCEMNGVGWVVYCFAVRSTSNFIRARTTTNEQIVHVDWKKNKEPVIPNLEWLIPLAREFFSNPMESSVHYLS